MMTDINSVTALWWAVIFSGLYHGINPGMGWPLAVSAALMERKQAAIPKALAMLALGHFLAMIGILLPFTLIIILIQWEVEIRIGAGLLVIAMGVYLLINRKHPRFLARVRPARLVLWSFLAAMAHGAGLMLVPLFFGICSVGVVESGHQAAETLMGSNILTAFAVAAIHTLSMTVAGGTIAIIIYFWLGLKFLSRTWFNLDIFWALSLVVVGTFGIYTAYSGH